MIGEQLGLGSDWTEQAADYGGDIVKFRVRKHGSLETDTRHRESGLIQRSGASGTV